MCKELRVTIFSLILLTVPTLYVRQSHAQASDSTPANSKENEGRVNAWLTSAGLAKSFEIIRIGDGPHPDPHFAFDGMIRHLELRFITAGSDQGQEAARFERLLADYQRDHARTLPEKLLYEFVDAFAIDPRNACADLHLYDVVYYIYFSRSDGSVVVLRGGNRDVKLDEFPVTIPAVAPQEQFRSHVGKQSAPDAKMVRDAVEKFLRTYLASVEGKGGPAPITGERTQDNVLKMSVNGTKGMVTGGYWEWYDIAVIFYPAPSAAIGKDSQWEFICMVEVKYASNARETHPQDAESDFPRQVTQFRTQLKQQLQASLEKGTHD